MDKQDASSNVKLADMGVCMVHTVEFMYCPLEVSLDELEQHTGALNRCHHWIVLIYFHG